MARMTAHRTPPHACPAPRQHAPRHPCRCLAPQSRAVPSTAVLLAAVLLTAALLAPPALQAAPEPDQGLAFGDSVIFGQCLKLTAVQVSDHDGPLEQHDWVTLSVSNGCSRPVRHLLVRLALYDARGQVYGGSVWVLDRGIMLPPGRQRMERYAVPDPGGLTAVRWDAQVLTVDSPRPRRRP